MEPYDSNRKGAIAEAEIAAAAVRLGASVLRPISEHGRYDLVFEIGGQLLRVQCKWAALEGDVIRIQLATSRSTPRGYLRETYSAHEIDAIAAYCHDLDECYFLPASLIAGKSALHLRRGPARNGQRAALNWAAEYRLSGAIAQLGERRRGTPEAVGSSPTSSTPGTTDGTPITIGAHEFRERFGYWMDRGANGDEIIVTRRGRPSVRLAPMQPRLAIVETNRVA
jgi:prevent-host-death family protein